MAKLDSTRLMDPPTMQRLTTLAFKQLYFLGRGSHKTHLALAKTTWGVVHKDFLNKNQETPQNPTKPTTTTTTTKASIRQCTITELPYLRPQRA
eukprot:4228458-Amphidinium_carterae.1